VSVGLTRFIVASGALHLALFAAWPVPTRTLVPGAAPRGPSLELRLGVVSTSGNVAVRPVHRARASAGFRRPRDRRLAPREARTTRAPRRIVARHPQVARVAEPVRPAPAPARPSRPAAAARAGGGGTSAAQFLRTSLLRLLGEHFTYPWIARRRGWEGEVRLALRVGAAGRVSDLRVVKTSGYAILDRAALRSARHIRAVPEAARWLRGRHLDIVVPVEYRLVNG
jgi:protein TonB